MGLDVGIVKINYLERPDQPVCDFLWNVATFPIDADWGGSWESNVFVEFFRETLEERAEEYTEEQSLDQDDSAKLMAWVKGLPWDEDSIMLHLNW